MKDHPFALKAIQAKLSFPVLERIFHRLKSGNMFDTIKADADCIIHGYHRYLCLSLLDIVPEISLWVSSPANRIIHWHDIIISPRDWDTREATGASVVLTTSHKSNYSISQWEHLFSQRGISISVERLQDNNKNLSRKDEILNWIQETNEEHFVIIDDDSSLNGLPPVLKEKLVLTKAMIGLTSIEAVTAINILRSSVIDFA